MRPFWRFALISFSVAAAFFVSLLIFDFVSSRPPRESRIVSHFKAHRASFERVRTMLSDDHGVEGVAPWGIQPNGSPIWKNPPDGGMPVERFREYLSLLHEIGASRVGKAENPLEVSFGVWSSGFAGDTRHVEITWLNREPKNTVTSLQAFYRTDKPRIPSYVHIDGNWYIWADW